MRIRSAFVLFSAMAVSSFAVAQSSLPPALHVGDDAPALPIAGVIKGDKTPESLKGKVTVIEFWATWCGPCIASMPHLSDLADSYKGKVNFYSVNTWDFRGSKGEKEEFEAHKARVADWVAKNTDKMRYNIVQDTQDDKISTSWMFAAGKYGIPCAFIVGKDGKIAWVGHPMTMEKPLEEISNGTWDVNAFKASENPKIDDARAGRELQLNISAAAKENNPAKIQALIEGAGARKATAVNYAIQYTMRTDPKASIGYAKEYYGHTGETGTREWAATFMSMAGVMKDDADKTELAKLSEKNAMASKEEEAALVYTYHARVLYSIGNKDSAMTWIEKAKAAVDQFPAGQKDSISKFIESTAKSFSKQ